MVDIILFQPKNSKNQKLKVPTRLLLTASVASDKGYKVKIIDQQICQNWKEALKNNIDSGAKIIYFAGMEFEQLDSITEASKFVISLNQNVLTIFGGDFAKAYPGMCMQDCNTDFVCCGDSEYFLYEFMEHLEEKRKPGDVLGMFWRGPEGAVIRKNNPRPLLEDLDELPKLPWNLLDLQAYSQIKNSVLELHTGFGGRKFSVKRIIEELECLEKMHEVKEFCLVDEFMAKYPERLEEFLNTLLRLNKDYRWSLKDVTAEQILNLEENVLENLENGGCFQLELFIGSGNEHIRKVIEINTPIENVIKANIKLSEYPISVIYKFCGGYPTENEQEFYGTLNFMKRLRSENKFASTTVSFFVPYPNTPLYQLAINNGYKPPTSLKDWAENNQWYKEELCWLTNKLIKLIENSSLVSSLGNKKARNLLTGSLYKTYLPFARLRSEKNFYGLMIEKPVLKLLSRMQNKIKQVVQTEQKDTLPKIEQIPIPESTMTLKEKS